MSLTHAFISAKTDGADDTIVRPVDWNNNHVTKLGGSTTTVAPLVAIANINTTAVGNVGAGEDTLITYSFPANAFSVTNLGVRITAWGTNANNANNKIIKLYFGTAAIVTSTTAAHVLTWRAEALVVRTGASTQDALARLTIGLAINTHTFTAITQTDTSAITIKMTGEGVADNDIVCEGMLIEFIG
jgi:hypothetical protein